MYHLFNDNDAKQQTIQLIPHEAPSTFKKVVPAIYYIQCFQCDATTMIICCRFNLP